MADAGMNDLVQRYKDRLGAQLGTDLSQPIAMDTREYRQFKEESYPTQFGMYEKWCLKAGKIMHPKLPPDKEQALQEMLDVAHINVKPSDTQALSYLAPLAYMLIGSALSIGVFSSLFFTVFFLFTGMGLMAVFQRIPSILANEWRMKASNQMVLCVFYVVTYMRHTSNLERAIEFAAEHLAPPLSLDLKKVLWDVETQKYSSAKEALDAYLERWKKSNDEFLEAMHLVMGSLAEGSEERRVGVLEKSLEVILDGTYEKMLHFAQNLKSPITMLHMLGVILPILGLVILPLMVAFMEGVKWYHVAVLYNIVLPATVFYMGKNILASRPTGYGDADISELSPDLKKAQNVMLRLGKSEIAVNPMVISVFVGCVLFLLGLVPILMFVMNGSVFGYEPFSFPEPFSGLKFLEYRKSGEDVIGPFGFGSAIMSLFIPLSFAFAFGLYYKLKTRNVMEVRDRTKKLEYEFSSALFQLSNRLGDGLPAEIAFDRVSEVMEDTTSGQFFKVVSTNIRKLGMGVSDAIFNPKSGAVVYFPSQVIHSSMKVLVEGVRKGPLIASQALMNVSRYIKEIHKVNERLQDLMAEIVADMTSQTSFLTPMISGIVIGITSMITTILGELKIRMATQGSEALGSAGGILNQFGDGMPTYYFQIVVGVYVFEIIFILTVMASGIQNGADKLSEQDSLGKTLIRGVVMYCVIGFGVMLTFNLIALKILEKSSGGIT